MSKTTSVNVSHVFYKVPCSVFLAMFYAHPLFYWIVVYIVRDNWCLFCLGVRFNGHSVADRNIDSAAT